MIPREIGGCLGNVLNYKVQKWRKTWLYRERSVIFFLFISDILYPTVVDTL